MEKRLKFLALLILFIYILPYFLFGEDVLIKGKENLNSVVVWYKTLIESGKIFSDSNDLIPSFMNVPRLSFYSEYSLQLWLHYFFGPLKAIVINEILVRLIGFYGMFLLLKNYLIKNDSLITVSVALLFSLFPILHIWQASLLGIPFVLFAFLNIYNNHRNKSNWLIIVLYPFYSNFHTISVFFYFVLFIGFSYLMIKDQTLNKRLLIAFSLMILLSVLINYRMIITFFFNETYVSHRVERGFFWLSFKAAILKSFSNFFIGLNTSRSLFQFIVIIPLSIFIILWKRNKNILAIVSVILIVSVFSAFFNWNKLEIIMENFNFLKMFNFSRLALLLPIAWLVVFALSLKELKDHFKHGLSFVYILVFIQIGILFYTNTHYKNHINKTLFNSTIQTSFKDYYSVNLLSRIDEFISKEKASYKVVSLGIDPSVARYNGFYCVDGLITNYPLDYKHKFAEIIKPELEKHPGKKRWFTKWGNSCYLVSSEITDDFAGKTNHTNKVRIKKLEINTTLLKDLGTKYIFSAVIIENSEQLNLQLLKTFSDDKDFTIHLYQL